jgi:hypothetical protein
MCCVCVVCVCTPKHMYTTNTCIHTYIHTRVQCLTKTMIGPRKRNTCIHTYTHTYIHTYTCAVPNENDDWTEEETNALLAAIEKCGDDVSQTWCLCARFMYICARFMYICAYISMCVCMFTMHCLLRLRNAGMMCVRLGTCAHDSRTCVRTYGCVYVCIQRLACCD